ncbi:DEKNAAC102204 [Brettanomyces naardenensis]|uniref:DEKNAAC102204 n=1 Tax=Brettanomyces naardenensis TaxID=13370 RepID=A0A448YKR8_BRENA|nr:DEKNAAC102204 [Brettanomyces naardenensis]
MPEQENDHNSSLTVQINASVALKLAKIGEDHYPGTSSGPIYGFDEKESSVINISHIMSFPGQHTSGDDVFNTRSSNVKFQNDFLSKLRESKIGAKLLGWYVTCTNGKHIRQTVIESVLHLQENNRKENADNTPVLILVYDPSKALDSLLSLKVLKLSDAFLNTWNSEARFVARNLIDNRLSYKNIFEEVPAEIKNSHLTNLKVQELDLSNTYGDDLELNSNYLKSTVQNVEQLTEAIDNFNHNLGNFNYFQRSLSREVTKVNQWKLRTKQENIDKLKADPSATVTEPDWKTQFKLPQVPSKYENLVASGLVNSYSTNLEVAGSVEHGKTSGVKESLDL